jgi:predicted alpha/beta-hydrolase family hydrolase
VRALAFLLLLAASCAVAQDYDREERWASEVVPNLVVGDAVRIEVPGGREFLGLYTGNKAARQAILLVHGIGVHPDHGIIGFLRAALADAGYATLSIQMPVLRAEAPASEYDPMLFPEAAARIQAGGEWLAAKGYAKPVLLSHSLGSRMANAYLDRAAPAPFAAWVCLGISGNFVRPASLGMPILEVYGEKDLPSVRREDWRRRMALDGVKDSTQIVIAGADHHYTGVEKALAAAILEFLRRVN